MALEPLWRSTLDKEGTLFTSKVEADKHDKKLELADAFASMVEGWFPGAFDEVKLEDLSLKVAEHKDEIAKALKGKPSALSDLVA